MITLTNILKELQEGKIEYPSDHQPGMRVTKGGSMCGNCEYHIAEDNKCKNEYWLKWHNNNEEIPYPADEYCCNWWHEK